MIVRIFWFFCIIVEYNFKCWNPKINYKTISLFFMCFLGLELFFYFIYSFKPILLEKQNSLPKSGYVRKNRSTFTGIHCVFFVQDLF